MEGIGKPLAVYFERRMARILMLGIISGFPQMLIGSSLSLWLKEDGLDRSTIGWAGLIFAVYAFNFLWAPLVDRIRIPWLTNRIGHRRAWIVALQAVILASLVAWSTVDPVANLTAVIAVGLVIAIASATQDIVVDALRIEQIGTAEGESMAAAAATAVVGWYTGFKLGGGRGVRNRRVVPACGRGGLLAIDVPGARGCRDPVQHRLDVRPRSAGDSSGRRTGGVEQRRVAARLGLAGPTGESGTLAAVSAWFVATVGGPLLSFFRRNGFAIAAAVLGFIFLFKIGEAFLGRMSLVFYNEVGFSKTDIALYSKGLGWVTTVAFTVLGGLFAIRMGLIRAMFLSGIGMAVTNLLFAALAWTGRSELLFAVAVVMDDLTSAFATVTFVAFISMLVDRTYTATQYALLNSIGTSGRTIFAASSGMFVDWLGGDWGTFFVITTLMVIPSLLCLWAIRAKLRDMLAGTSVRLFGKEPAAA